MQLSLPSAPADSGTSSLLNGLPGAAGTASNSAAAADPCAPDGFAQVLAGCGTPGNGTVTPAPAGPLGAVNPAPITVFNFADASTAPLAAAVGPLVAGQLVPVPPRMLPGEDDSSALTTTVGDETTPSTGPRAKDLAALGDLQALASLVTAVPPAPVAIAGALSANADGSANQAGPALANSDGDLGNAAASKPLPWAGGPRTTMAAVPSLRSPLTPAFAASDDTSFGRTFVQLGASTPVPTASSPGQTPQTSDRVAVPAITTPAVDDGTSAPAVSITGSAPSPAMAEATVPPRTAVANTPAAEQVRAAAVQIQGAEKIAAAGADSLRRTDRVGIKVDAKSFVAADRKALTGFDPGLGIDTAKPSVTMPAGATLDRKTSSDPVVPTSAPVSESRADSTLPAPVALTSTAHRAVEAALATADRFSARDQHSVTLQFSVGGSDLNVRVELRAGEVHTTFRTDSADLRAALSSEWQAVTSQSPADRPVRLAAPVFTSAQDSGASFSGDGANRQHQQESANAGSSYPGSPSFRGSSRATGTVAAGSPATPAPARAAAANSVHLHTLA